ncbi:hypothetical protein [Pantoea vagans]|uniref:hypothetical protein n=1 Tax=Pantoea vagans TaxID=470934 RepID=UPI0023AE82BF|nr:hypothetical protein [Pantoea vagans]MDE8555209.1 hypothetical protein [Pantoea vagans]MDE8575260.1 hypothetical protein [Pantoea vagans]
MDKRVRTGLLLAADLLAVGRMIAVMDNFCAARALPDDRAALTVCGIYFCVKD